MTPETDYYGILQIRRDAPTEVIEMSYRTLARSLHQQTGAENPRAALLHEAYRVLSDPQERARYDRQLGSSRQLPPATPHRAGPEACLFCGAAVPAAESNTADRLCGRCSSPLAPVTPRRFEHSMRRQFRRVARRQKIEVYTQWGCEPMTGWMQNLSSNGMRFSSSHEFDTNQLIKIDSQMCKALARVSYCQRAESAEYATGVEFVTILFS